MGDRNVRLLFAGRTISYVGTYLAPIAVAFAIIGLHGSATAVGLSFAAWRMQKANSYLAIARYAAFPLGAATGGSIVATVGSGTALLIDGGTYAASALLLSFVHVDSVARAGSSVLHELREGWAAFVEHTWIWLLTLWISLYFLITYAPFFVLGPYARAGERVRLDVGDGVPAGGLRARRADRERRRHARVPSLRRRVARGQHARRRAPAVRARVRLRGGGRLGACGGARLSRLRLDEPERAVGAVEPSCAFDLCKRRREHAHRLAVELCERAVELALR